MRRGALGLQQSVVWKLIYGDASRNQAPSQRIRPATEAKILAVDLDLVPQLTNEDLKEIGVASVGHRRLLLQAVATLSAAPAGPAPAAARPGSSGRR